MKTVESNLPAKYEGQIGRRPVVNAGVGIALKPL